MNTKAPANCNVSATCPLHELIRCKKDKCCKNWKHGKRCKKCPKK